MALKKSFFHLVIIGFVSILVAGCNLDGEALPGNVDDVMVQASDAFCLDGSFTVEGWIYIDGALGAGEQPRILSKYSHVNPSGNVDHSYRGWEWILFGTERLRFRMEFPDPAGRIDTWVDSPNPLPTNEWIHVATVYDDATKQMSLFLNGALEAHKTVATTVSPECAVNQPLYFGRYGSDGIHRFAGMVDEVRIVAEALTLTDAPRGPYQPSDHPKTVALYHFDETVEGLLIVNEVGDTLPILLPRNSNDILADGPPGFGQALVLKK